MDAMAMIETMDTVELAVVGAMVGLVLMLLYTMLSPKTLSFALKGAQTKVTLTLREQIPVTDNVKIYRFNLPRASDRLGLPDGKHFTTHAMVDGEEVERPYTPITSNDEVGYVDLMIKVYPKGKMGNHINDLKPGDPLEVSGPKGIYQYNGNGSCKVSGKKERVVKQINMICGGSGVTPMLQVLRAVLKKSEDPTKIKMIFGNQTVDDILLRGELDACNEDPRFDMHYTIDRAPESGEWDYSVGYITSQMIQERLFPSSPETMTLLCGPPPMVNGCKKTLVELGHAKTDMHSF